MKMNIFNNRFAFLGINRKISTNKGLVESIKVNGVLQPILVTKGSNVGEELLYDVNNNVEIAQEKKDDYNVVLDGQHRLTTLMKVLKEKKEVTEADKMIPAYIVTKEDIKNDVNGYIMAINSTSKNWNNGDYIKNAIQTKPDDELIQAIVAFERRKFSISTISRYICLNSSLINNKTLTEYANKAKEIKFVDYKRAIRLYLFLTGKGLSDSFLRKRYMIDYIAEMKKQYDSINPVLNLINYLQKDAIDKINTLKSSEGDVSKAIDEILHQNFDNVLNNADSEEQRREIESPKDYLALVSEEEVRNFIEQPVERKSVKRSPSTKSKEEVLTEPLDEVQTESNSQIEPQGKNIPTRLRNDDFDIPNAS